MKRIFDLDKLGVKNKITLLEKTTIFVKIGLFLFIIACLFILYSRINNITSNINKMNDTATNISYKLDNTEIGIKEALERLTLEHTAPLELREAVAEIRTTCILNKEGIDKEMIGYGSGTLLAVNKEENEFLILTASHVVHNGDLRTDRIVIRLNGKKYKNITVIKKNPKEDLALLLVKGETKASPITLSKYNPQVGSTIWYVSNPLQLTKVINKSIVSKYHKGVMVTAMGAVSGASGGMVVNIKHEYVGVISAMAMVTLPVKAYPGLNIGHPTIYSVVIPVNKVHKFLRGVI